MSPEVRGQLQRIFGEGTVAGLTDGQLLARFVSARDEVAFSALVSRHGPMVLGVCRGVVGDEHEAEDAFQATFLVLARKARSLRVDDSLGGWLHRVSRRIAVETSRRRTRQRKFERDGQPIDAVAVTHDPTQAGLLAALHAEIDRLPAKYRLPIVLCDLQSFTRDEAAGHLGWPAGTVAGRLARARALLRDRLTRRGLFAAAAALAVPRELSAAVPAGWVERTAKAALGFVSRNRSAVETASATAISLAEEVLTMMFRATLRKLTLLFLPFAAVVGAVAFAALAQSDAKQTITGRVVGPGGKPEDGVRVFYTARVPTMRWSEDLTEVRPDADGRIHLDIPPITINWNGLPMGALWAYKPGALVSVAPLYRGTNSQDVPVPLVVNLPAYTPFEVRDVDGKPIVGATIEPTGIGTGLPVGKALGKLIAAKTVTDAEGRATMTSFFPEEVTGVAVTAPGFGRQAFHFNRRDVPLGRKVLTLLPTTRVKGRLTGNPAEIRGRRLHVFTSKYPRPSPSISSNVTLTTDEEGRFEASGLIPGNLSIETERDITSPTFVQSDPTVVIEAGKTAEFELPVSKSIKIAGVVRDKATGKPIPGVEVASLSGASVNTVTTDAEGRFEGFDHARSHLIGIVKYPKGYASLHYMDSGAKFPEDAAEIEWPPFELSRAGDVHGVVIDSKGKPVAGADVVATWILDEGKYRSGPTRASVRSGRDGQFDVEGVTLGSEVKLTAGHLGLRTPQSITTIAGAEEPVRLQIDDSHAVAVNGRVVDPDGRPIAGAHVHLRRAVEFVKRGEETTIQKDELVDFGGEAILITDADGRFQTPRQLDVEETYSVYATMPGRVSARSEWRPAGVVTFPDITLAPEREVP